ncbi:MAG: hypothetical protein HYV28_04095 [Ignavibacteriales bacterium]|nr:hypothetical protein [Ignavibacteriales bacterium]
MKKCVLFLCLLCNVFISAQITNPENRKKISGVLIRELDRVERLRNHDVFSSAEIAAIINKEIIPVDSYLRIALQVTLRTENVKRQLGSLGCDVLQIPDGNYNLWVPYDKLDAVASLNAVAYLTTIRVQNVHPIPIPRPDPIPVPHPGPKPHPYPHPKPHPQPDPAPSPQPEKERPNPQPSKDMPVSRRSGGR